MKNKIDHSASLSALLREAEVAHFETDSAAALSVSRKAVVDAALHYKSARYRFGKALYIYKAAIPYAGWMIAVQIIAKAIGVNERTVRNALAAYERTVPLPEDVIDALEDAGLDPAARKNAKIIDFLTGAEISDPVKAVALAISESKSPSLPSGASQPSAAERVVFKVRTAIRSALRNVPANRKLDVLTNAIAEEVYALIGATRPFTVTPRKPALDLMGLKRTEALTPDREESA